MRKLFFVFAFVFSISTQAFNSTPVSEKTEENIEFKAKTTLDFGTCHIQIIDLQTNEVVYEVTLIANTPEECTKMGKRTLQAFIDGEL